MSNQSKEGVHPDYWVAIDQIVEIKRLHARIETLEGALAALREHVKQIVRDYAHLEATLRTIRDDEKNCANYCRRQADKALRISARAKNKKAGQ